MQGPFGGCPACGGAVGATARFCGSCGRPIAAPPAATPVARSSGSRTRAIAAIVAVAIVVVGIGVGAGLVLLRPGAGTTGGTGGTASDAVPAASSAAAGPSGTSDGDGVPGAALATAPIVDGHADDSALVPPILEEGDIPPAEDPAPPVTGHLSVGPAVDLASGALGPAGGTLEANGLRIEVPEGALTADTLVSVTQAPVESADFGGQFTPLTPLYTIEAGDAALAAAVTVTLPATVPDGAIALAFYYDDAAGTLTPLAPVDADATSITAGALHFSGIVGGVFNADKAKVADSGFRPGIDDWQFTNYGSYVAPRGQCEGMSDSAIWYYIFQRRKGGASPLYGLYDNNGASDRTPTFQWDDSDGYRLAGNVQADPTADRSRFEASWKRMFGRPDDRMTYTALRAAINFTGEPQEITISATVDRPQHAMIVYRVTADRLFIADPNYPGRLRTIRYDAATGRLAPYASGANAADIAANGAKMYPFFAYVPWRTAASEASLAAHWAEFETGKAGDSAYPKYALEALAGTDDQGNETWVPLVDGYTSQAEQLTIRLRDPVPPRTPDEANDVALEVFPGTASTALAPLSAEQTIDLRDGATPLGIKISFSRRSDTKWRYVDFVRLSVTRGPPAAGKWVLASARGSTLHPNDAEASLVGSRFKFTDEEIWLTHWEAWPDTEGNPTGSRISGQSRVYWSYPPNQAVPGDTWQTVVSVEPVCEPFTLFRIKVSVTAEGAIPADGGEVASHEQARCELADVTGSFTFPAPSNPSSPSSTLQVDVSLEVPGVNTGTYAYTYTWQP